MENISIYIYFRYYYYHKIQYLLTMFCTVLNWSKHQLAGNVNVHVKCFFFYLLTNLIELCKQAYLKFD